MKKIIGVIGGMGPLATMDFVEKLIMMTDAGCDADHLHVIIDSNTEIPDRVKAILADGEDPLPQMITSAKRLVQAGAQLLVMPCNTAHYYYEAIKAQVDVPFISMPRETVKDMASRGIRRAALLATSATIEAGVYTPLFEEAGIELMTLPPSGQAELMRHIFEGVKRGINDMDGAVLASELERMRASGAETFVLACTEVPIVFKNCGFTYPSTDATLILARRAVEEGGAKLKDLP